MNPLNTEILVIKIFPAERHTKAETEEYLRGLKDTEIEAWLLRLYLEAFIDDEIAIPS